MWIWELDFLCNVSFTLFWPPTSRPGPTVLQVNKKVFAFRPHDSNPPILLLLAPSHWILQWITSIIYILSIPIITAVESMKFIIIHWSIDWNGRIIQCIKFIDSSPLKNHFCCIKIFVQFVSTTGLQCIGNEGYTCSPMVSTSEQTKLIWNQGPSYLILIFITRVVSLYILGNNIIVTFGILPILFRGFLTGKLQCLHVESLIVLID